MFTIELTKKKIGIHRKSFKIYGIRLLPLTSFANRKKSASLAEQHVDCDRTSYVNQSPCALYRVVSCTLHRKLASISGREHHRRYPTRNAYNYDAISRGERSIIKQYCRANMAAMKCVARSLADSRTSYASST